MLEGLIAVSERIQEINEKITKLYPSTTLDKKTETLPKNDTNKFSDIITEVSKRYGVDDKLVESMITVESNFNPYAVSPKGAAGLMQIMPETAKELNVKDPFDPSDNIEGGIRYLRSLLMRYDNDIQKALAAYNAGPSKVDKFNGIPNIPETVNYVNKVMNLYNKKGV